MRITAEEKEATRGRILDAARKLFRKQGFDQATTRDLAREAGIAAGTLFNYFASKEAVVVHLAGEAIEKADGEFLKTRREQTSLGEELFAHIAMQLRRLRPIRPYLRPLLETALSPAVVPPEGGREAELRRSLAERFGEILCRHGAQDPSPVAMQMLWSLYVGVLTFWSGDKSPKQEDSLALLDQSTQMFAQWLLSQ